MSTTTTTTTTTEAPVVQLKNSLTTQTLMAGNLCSASICQNQGICYQTSATSFYCKCQIGYSGLLCQFDDPCVSTPCKNAATCISLPTVNIFYCVCPSGYSGLNCEVSLRDQCKYNNGNCLNGASCVFDESSQTNQCVCLPLYTGNRCDQYMNPCFSTFG